MMVAQAPFESDIHQFCKAIPIARMNGERLALTDFPNDGEIWWMLTAKTARLAAPGRLFAGVLETAMRYDEYDPTSSFYQLKRDSVQELESKDGMELLEVPADSLNGIQDIASGSFRLALKVPPTPLVLLSWRANVYGPFIATQDLSDCDFYSFSPKNPADLSVF